MPWRPVTRDQAWLFPPTLDDLLPQDHPARFVLSFVDALPPDLQTAFETAAPALPLGAPAYQPKVLLCAWIYGFMTRTRSSRRLETACRDQIPLLWLTGWQHPDHNTLWRFYKTHREQLHLLLKQTVKVAVRLGLVDWAVQAIDGTKIAGNAAKARSLDPAYLCRLLERTEAAIADLEAQNQGADGAQPPRLPGAWCDAQVLRERLREALAESEADGRPVNLTDADTRLMKGRQGTVAGYNAQAAVAPMVAKAGGGLLITAALVTQAANDQGLLLPVAQEAAAMTGGTPGLTLADAGYLSGPSLTACAEAGLPVVIADGHLHPDKPYHKDRFTYDATTDSYTCPEGQVIPFSYEKHKRGEAPARVYQAGIATCGRCPAFGRCTKNGVQGRRIERTAHDEALHAHHAWMQTPAAQAAYRLRKQLVEPAFGILKECMDARRFLLRGLANVRCEWAFLATAFNLRTLRRVWARSGGRQWGALMAA